MINTDNDLVEVYKNKGRKKGWRWRRIDRTNNKVLSISSESYVDKDYCLETALAYNPGVEVREV